MFEKIIFLGISEPDAGIFRQKNTDIMPNLSALAKRGMRGKFGETPWLSNSSEWATIITGKQPDEHRILTDNAIRADDVAIQPVSRFNLRRNPLWERISMQGHPTTAINWPASHPVMDVNNSYLVSNLFKKCEHGDYQTSAIIPGSISLPKHVSELVDMRVSSDEIGMEELEWLFPGLRRIKINDAVSRSLDLARKIIAETSSVHAVSTYLLSEQNFTLHSCHYDIIRNARHCIIDIWNNLDKKDRSHFDMQSILARWHAFLDNMLDAYRYDKKTGVVIISEREITLSITENRLNVLPETGSFIIPVKNIDNNIEHDTHSKIDIAPTIFHLLEKDAPSDLKGDVITRHLAPVKYSDQATNIFTKKSTLSSCLRSWLKNADLDEARINKIRNIYIDLKKTHKLNEFINLARYYIPIKPRHARRLLKVIKNDIHTSPELHEIYALCLWQLSDYDDLNRFINSVTLANKNTLYFLMGENEWHKNNFDNAINYYKKSLDTHNHSHKILETISDRFTVKEEYALAEKTLLALHDTGSTGKTFRNLGYIYYKQGRYEKAIYWLKKSLEANKNQKDVCNLTGKCYELCGDTTAAHESYRQTLDMDPTDKVALKGLVNLLVK